MSVSGFKINGVTEKYNYPDLDNINVLTSHIQDGAITRSKIADGAVSDVKMDPNGVKQTLMAETIETVTDITLVASQVSWNANLSCIIYPDYLYTLTITVDEPLSQASTIYWRNPKLTVSGQNINLIGTIPANVSTYTFENVSPSGKRATHMRINNAIVGASYHIVITKVSKNYSIPTITSYINNVKNDLKNSSIDGLIYRSILPEYYFAENEDPQTYADSDQYLDGIINTVPNGKHFLYVTDTHWTRNAHNINQLLQYTRARLNSEDYVIFGGDALERASSSYKAKQTLCEYFNECVSAFGKKYLPAWGNHDLNTAADDNVSEEIINVERLDVGVSADIFTKHLIGSAVFEDYHDYEYETALAGDMIDVITEIVDDAIEADSTIPETLSKTRDEIIDALMKYNRLHYYVDDHINHIRYIIYNTGCPSNPIVKKILGVQGTSETYLQIYWFHNVLMTTPSGYDIVVCAHEVIYDPYHITSGTTELATSIYMKDMLCQLSALKLKMPSIPVNIAASSNIPNKYTPLSTQNLYFGGAPDVGKILVLTGHWHKDFSAVGKYSENWSNLNDYHVTEINPETTVDETNGEILIVCSRCDKDRLDSSTPVTMLTGTDENAFDIVSLTDNTIKFTRVGYSATNTASRTFVIA